MNKIAIFLLICSIQISVYAEQTAISKKSLLVQSEYIASEMGKTYQLARNCGQVLDNISTNNTATLFRNYFEEDDVKNIMKQYKEYVAQEKGKSCNRDKVEFHLLMKKLSVYIRMGASFRK